VRGSRHLRDRPRLVFKMLKQPLAILVGHAGEDKRSARMLGVVGTNHASTVAEHRAPARAPWRGARYARFVSAIAAAKARRASVGIAAAVSVVAVCSGARPVVAAQSTPLCRARDLAGAIIDIQGAAGSRFGRLILVNASSRTCHTKGFIGGRFVGTDGRSITTHVTRDHSTPTRTVVIKPGAAGALQLRWNVVPSGSSRSCKTARWLRVTPPDDTTSLRVYFGSTPCRGDLEVRAITDPRQVS
jgi:hypothetical protein